MKNNNKLKVIPLGGMKEIGKNLTVIEYRDDIIIVDCGITFPEEEMLGIDVVIPDFTYLKKNRNKIKGLVLTHGHEDHIGAIPYLLKEIPNIEIYGTDLTIGLLESKLKEHKISDDNLNVVNYGSIIKLGKMEVEFIQTTHSIPGSAAIAIRTPQGIIVHTGDFKVDLTPIDGVPIDLNRFAELGNEGVLLLLSDSTNATRAGQTLSEKNVGKTFDALFSKYPDQRLIIASFASNVHRIQQIINSSEKYGRKVILSGRSMMNVTETALALNKLKVKKDTLIDIKEMNKYDPSQLVIITTGSQGEPLSALTRIAYGEHKRIKIVPGSDVVILSANPIPGNEISVNRVINQLMESGAEVIYKTLSEIHVSGHASREDLKLVMSLVKPKYFLPAHGEVAHLLAHGEIARELGIPVRNIIYLRNGDSVEFDAEGMKYGESVPSGDVLIDGYGIGDVGNIVLRDRRVLSENGLIIVVVGISKKARKLVSGPDIVSRGFVYVRESEDLISDATDIVSKTIKKLEKSGNMDWNFIKSNIKDDLSNYISCQTGRDPMIIPIIMEV